MWTWTPSRALHNMSYNSHNLAAFLLSPPWKPTEITPCSVLCTEYCHYGGTTAVPWLWSAVVAGICIRPRAPLKLVLRTRKAASRMSKKSVRISSRRRHGRNAFSRPPTGAEAHRICSSAMREWLYVDGSPRCASLRCYVGEAGACGTWDQRPCCQPQPLSPLLSLPP